MEVSAVVQIYKAQVLSYLEYRTAAIYHSCDSVLSPLNELQAKFLRELGLSPTDALLYFALAPLHTRRDMSMLGLIHRTVLNKGPSHFQTYFAKVPLTARRTNPQSLTCS